MLLAILKMEFFKLAIYIYPKLNNIQKI